MQTTERKKIDWSIWKKKCPKCNSINLEYQNTYKRNYIATKADLKLKEFQKVICKDCGHEFWK